MSKQLLIESLTVDCSKDVVKRTDILESLQNGKTKVSFPVIKEGKTILEDQELDVLSVYRVPISRPGVLNKNNRLYTMEQTWKPVLEKQLGEGSIGLLNHPKPGEAPDIEKACVVWRNHKAEIGENGNPIIKADMYLLNDKKGNGNLVESIIKAGGKVDLSTRGYGEINTKNEVYNYEYKSTDVVYEGSFGVQAEKSHKYTPEEIPFIKEEVNNQNEHTNNHKTTGDSPMNKIIIKRLIDESLKKENKFSTYSELSELAEGIRDNKEVADLYEGIQKKLVELKPLLEQEYQGDADDNGSADADNAGLDPENKIEDTNEDEPEDVEDEQIEVIADTKQSDRSGRLGIKAGSSEKAMAAEKMSGNISHVTQGMKKNVKEDTNEDEPEDVEEVEVEDIEDTDERPAYTDVKAGGGGDAEKKEDEPDNSDVEKIESLQQLGKDELIEVALKLDEAVTALQGEYIHEQKMFDALSTLYLKLESYTLKAERVVEMDKTSKEKAQKEVTEAVEFAKAMKAEKEGLLAEALKQKEYIEKLEDIVVEHENALNESEQVLPYVNEMLAANPQLAPYANEIKTASTVQEAIQLAGKYSSMKGKIRLDRVMTEDTATEAGEINEAKSYLKRNNWI